MIYDYKPWVKYNAFNILLKTLIIIIGDWVRKLIIIIIIRVLILLFVLL